MSEDGDVLDGAVPPRENTVLFGHEGAEAFLANAYKAGKIHHAVLIEGPAGIGKATLAFRFANHVLCNPDALAAPEAVADPDVGHPIHRQIVSGASHHLIHLARPADEKTGRTKNAITVDEVRRVGRFLSQTSGTGNWRIVIVDPADDLNRAAANAILKMLEEPPKNALFLVVSHAPGRLLPTIRSRCLPLRLQPLGDVDLLKALAHLGLQKTAKAAEIEGAVARAGGSVGRALMLLRYGGLEIAAAFEAIMRAGPAAARSDLHRLADTLSAKDREMAFRFLQGEVGDWLFERARAEALAGRISTAARLSELASTVERDWNEAAAYNLDRKQTILSMFSSLFAGGAA